MNESPDNVGTSGVSAPRVDAHTREAADVPDPGEMALDCTRCGEPRYYRREQGARVVRCRDCGKRHAIDSLFMVTA